MNEEKVYRIKEVALMLNTSKSTLQRLDRLGITSTKRAAFSNERLYSDSDIEKARKYLDERKLRKEKLKQLKEEMRKVRGV